jgi:transposase
MKNDFRDAEAIAEAVQRPTMKFVATKTAEQLDLQALHRVRERLDGVTGRSRRKPLARYSAIEGAPHSRLLAQRRSSLKLMVSFNRSRGLPAPSIIEGRP